MVNCLLLGTPGVGKSLMSRILSEKTGLAWIDVSKFAIENKCLKEYDEVYQCPILDEDEVIKFTRARLKTLFHL